MSTDDSNIPHGEVETSMGLELRSYPDYHGTYRTMNKHNPPSWGTHQQPGGQDSSERGPPRLQVNTYAQPSSMYESFALNPDLLERSPSSTASSSSGYCSTPSTPEHETQVYRTLPIRGGSQYPRHPTRTLQANPEQGIDGYIPTRLRDLDYTCMVEASYTTGDSGLLANQDMTLVQSVRFMQAGDSGSIEDGPEDFGWSASRQQRPGQGFGVEGSCYALYSPSVESCPAVSPADWNDVPVDQNTAHGPYIPAPTYHATSTTPWQSVSDEDAMSVSSYTVINHDDVSDDLAFVAASVFEISHQGINGSPDHVETGTNTMELNNAHIIFGHGNAPSSYSFTLEGDSGIPDHTIAAMDTMESNDGHGGFGHGSSLATYSYDVSGDSSTAIHDAFGQEAGPSISSMDFPGDSGSMIHEASLNDLSHSHRPHETNTSRNPPTETTQTVSGSRSHRISGNNTRRRISNQAVEIRTMYNGREVIGELIPVDTQQCPHAGCSSTFRRREHLSRHVKSLHMPDKQGAAAAYCWQHEIGCKDWCPQMGKKKPKAGGGTSRHDNGNQHDETHFGNGRNVTVLAEFFEFLIRKYQEPAAAEKRIAGVYKQLCKHLHTRQNYFLATEWHVPLHESHPDWAAFLEADVGKSRAFEKLRTLNKLKKLSGVLVAGDNLDVESRRGSVASAEEDVTSPGFTFMSDPDTGALNNSTNVKVEPDFESSSPRPQEQEFAQVTVLRRQIPHRTRRFPQRNP